MIVSKIKLLNKYFFFKKKKLLLFRLLVTCLLKDNYQK